MQPRIEHCGQRAHGSPDTLTGLPGEPRNDAQTQLGNSWSSPVRQQSELVGHVSSWETAAIAYAEGTASFWEQASHAQLYPSTGKKRTG